MKLDDGFTMHPKVIGLSLEARWAYVEGLCYAARYLTDGVVPSVVAANGSVRVELLTAGLWENGPEGDVSIHDYLLYNPSKEDVEYLSGVRSKAGRASARTRAATGVEQVSYGDGTGLAVGGGGPGEGDAFEAFWEAYPRHSGQSKAKARQKFLSKVRACRVDPWSVVAGAERYRDDSNRDDEFTAMAQTWLNQERWGDPPLPDRRRHGEGVVEKHLRIAAEEVINGVDISAGSGIRREAAGELSRVAPDRHERPRAR